MTLDTGGRILHWNPILQPSDLPPDFELVHDYNIAYLIHMYDKDDVDTSVTVPVDRLYLILIKLQCVMILVHTEVIYGIREVNPLTPMTVQEGEDITITVGLLGPDSPNLDDDFVVGYTVKILYGGVHGNATGILYILCIVYC